MFLKINIGGCLYRKLKQQAFHEGDNSKWKKKEEERSSHLGKIYSKHYIGIVSLVFNIEGEAH